MGSRYQFSEAEIREIEQARKGNKNKRVEARLKALELRAKGAKAKEVHRHGWRKVMPRSKHPKKASDEDIAASKK